MPFEQKLADDFVKAFTEGATKEDLTKLNKLVKDAMKRLKDEQ